MNPPNPTQGGIEWEAEPTSRVAVWWWNLRWRVGYWIGGFTYARRGEVSELLDD